MFDFKKIDYSGKFGDSFVEGVGWNFLGNNSLGVDILVSLFDLVSSVFRKNETKQLKYFRPNLDLFELNIKTDYLEYVFINDAKSGLENNTVLRRLTTLFVIVFSVLIIFIDSANKSRYNNEDFLIFFWVIVYILLPFYIIYKLRITYKKLLLNTILNYKISFNKNSEYFYKGFINNPLEENNNKIYFNTIYAVQVLEKIVHGKNSDFYYYEINLVLKDKTRINIIEASGDYNLKTVKKDAQTIGEFIGVPVWDMSGIEG